MENFEPIEFQQSRDFSKKVNITFGFISQNFKPFSKSLLFIAGPPILLGGIFTGSVYGKFLNFSTDMSRRVGLEPEGIESTFASYGFWLEIVGAMVFAFLAVVFVLAVVNTYLITYERKKTNQIEVSEIWEGVRESFWQHAGTMILYIIAIMATYFICLLPMLLFVAINPFLAFFGVVILIVAMMYVWNNLSLIFFIRAYEKKGFVSAIQRSFYLIKGKWWSTFGLVMIMGMITGSVSSLFLIPWYVNFFIGTMHSLETNVFEEPSLVSQVINNIFLTLYFLSSFLLYSLTFVALAFQYFNLVELKEARGLMSRINTVGQTPTQSSANDETY